MTTRRRLRSRIHRAVRSATVEALELRRLLNAPIVVNTTQDETTAADGLISLREAVDLAAGTAGDDTINFEQTVFASGSLHTITLTGGPDIVYLNSAQGALTINGPGTDVLEVKGGGSNVFAFATGTVVSISGMNIANGVTAGFAGGGIDNDGTLTLDHVRLHHNTANGDKGTGASDGTIGAGGAIYNTGTLTITDSEIDHNTAKGGEGGTDASGNGRGGRGDGGGIYTSGPVSLTNVSFHENLAQGGNGGNFATQDGGRGGDADGGSIMTVSASAPLSITGGRFDNDEAIGGNGGTVDVSHTGGRGGDARGGDLYILPNATTLSGVTFHNSEVGAGNGGLGQIQGDGGNGLGGSVYNANATTGTDLHFDSEFAFGGDGFSAGFAWGGAIYNLNTLHLLGHCTFVGNDATGGKTFSDAIGGEARGGAIANGSIAANLDVTGATFSMNTVFGGASQAGNGGQGSGGAIYSDMKIAVAFCDFESNTVTGGMGANLTVGTNGGFALGGAMLIGGTATISSSLLESNTVTGGKGGHGSATNGGAGGLGRGGAIYLEPGTLTIDDSTMEFNFATGGDGGDGSTNGGNGGAADGGAVFMDNTTMNLINCTLAVNTAHGGAGGQGNSLDGAKGVERGGAVDISDILNVTNTIIDNNNAADGPNLKGSVTLVHSLVSTTDAGYTVLAGSHDNVLGQSADLLGLADNGGPTETDLPQTFSPAVNAGDNSAVVSSFDQRGPGFPRIVGGTVDMGAAEVPLAVMTLLGNGKIIPEDDTTPSSLDFTDFGTAKLGTPIDRTFTVRNDGTATLNLGFISLPFGFSVLSPFAGTVNPGDTTNFTLRFNPNLPGAFGGNVEISNNVGGGLNHFDFTIAATANGGAFRVNFQPAASEVPSGYLLDSGQAFGNRGNGYSYGFDGSAQSFTRERNVVNDQAKDTLVHTQLFGTRNWDVVVPNGTYKVHLVAGDPSFFDSVYKINVEGVLTVNGTPTSGNRFVEGTKTVTVTDGKLSITNAAGAVNNKLDFIEITPVYNINFQPAGAPIPAGYQADTGATFGVHGAGMSYGWNASATSFARDRNNPKSPDQRYDTLIHTQLFGNRTWEIAVPNGSYEVHLVAGDPNFTDSVYKYDVEGILTVSGTPTANKRWIEGTQTVLVLDGKLTITNSAGATNNKIAFVDITAQ